MLLIISSMYNIVHCFIKIFVEKFINHNSLMLHTNLSYFDRFSTCICSLNITFDQMFKSIRSGNNVPHICHVQGFCSSFVFVWPVTDTFYVLIFWINGFQMQMESWVRYCEVKFMWFISFLGKWIKSNYVIIIYIKIIIAQSKASLFFKTT